MTEQATRPRPVSLWSMAGALGIIPAFWWCGFHSDRMKGGWEQLEIPMPWTMALATSVNVWGHLAIGIVLAATILLKDLKVPPERRQLLNGIYLSLVTVIIALAYIASTYPMITLGPAP